MKPSVLMPAFNEANTSVTRGLLALLMAMVFTVVEPSRVSACSCAGGLPLREYLASSAAIFAGRVVTPEEVSSSEIVLMAPPIVDVHVSRIWKGPGDQVITLHNDTPCPATFETGKEYLIFAHEVDGQLYTSLCSRNQLLETAQEDLALLDNIYSSPVLQFHRPATVTVQGHSAYQAGVTQISVHFLFAEPLETEAPDEKVRQRVADALAANGITQEMIHGGWFYGDQTGFRFSVNHEHFPNYSAAEFLDLLIAAQKALAQAGEAAIDRVEVMFGIRDCTWPVSTAQRHALGDAQTRGELLAAMVGGRLGAVVGMADVSAAPPVSVGGYVQCGIVPVGEWHELPLQVDLHEAMNIPLEVTLSVTFAVEDAVTPAGPTPTASSSRFVSPLPTPTPQRSGDTVP
jgi:hypothetical protein